MSLVGAKFICLDEKGDHGETIEAKGRKFTIGYYMSCDHVIVDKNAKGLHCEINCDAFGRVTIHNMSKEHPVYVNGQPITIKRPLLSGSKITILGKHYFWDFPKTSSSEFEDINSASVSTPQKYVGIPEQPPNSCPSFKLNRNAQRRFTVHNFAYCIQSDEEGNTSTDSNTSPVKDTTEDSKDNELTENAVSLVPVMEDTALEERCSTPYTENSSVLINIDETPKTNLINFTQNKENTTTEKKKKLLSMCIQSDIVITSFSPRETGVRIEKSFTAVLKPTTPKSLYSTPKSILSEFNNDGSIDIDFSTPASSKKTMLRAVNNSSMHLIDLTTPSQFRPISTSSKSVQKIATPMNIVKATEISADDSQKISNLSNDMKECGVSILRTPKTGDELSTTKTPDSVISVDSTDSSSVVEVSEDNSTPGSPLIKIASIKTPNKTGSSKINTTPKRTPQSLMKRALLTSAKKQITTQSVTPKCGVVSGGLLARRQSLTSPNRKNLFNSKTKLANPANQTCSLQARRSLYGMPSRTLTTSTPDGRSVIKRVSPKTSPLHRVRKSIGDSILSSHISKGRKSIAHINKSTPSSSVTLRKSLHSTPGSARARAMAASASQPASILKDPQSTKKLDDQKKAVLFSVEDENDLSRTFTLDSEIEAPDENIVNDVTSSPIKDSKEVIKLNVTFSPEKQELTVNTEHISRIEIKNMIHEAKTINADPEDTNSKENTNQIEANIVINEDNDDLLEQIEDVLNKSDELQKQSKVHGSHSIIKEDEFKQSEELESLFDSNLDDDKNASIQKIENSEEYSELPKGVDESDRDESSLDNKISKVRIEGEMTEEPSHESDINTVDRSTMIVCNPQTPKLSGIKELLRTPRDKMPQKSLVGVRDKMHTPKDSKVEDCSELLGVEIICNKSQGQDNSRLELTSEKPFTPRRSARRASLSADSFRNLTPKRITKRRASISVDTDVKIVPSKQKIPHMKKFDTFDEIEEDIKDIASEFSKEKAEFSNSKFIGSIQNQQISLENKNHSLKTYIEDNFEGDERVIEESTCEILDSPECYTNNNIKNELSSKVSKCLDTPANSTTDLSSVQDGKTDSICTIDDDSDYSYGKEVNTSTDVPKSDEIKADTLEEIFTKSNDFHDKNTDEPIINSEIQEVTKAEETEKPSTSSEANLNLIGRPGQCSTPRSVKTPKLCSTVCLEGIKELMDTPTLRTPVGSSKDNLNKSDDENLDQFFRTPRAKNVMILGTPKSINIKMDKDSVELVHSTEYELNTDVVNLEDIFKTPVAARFNPNVTIDDESVSSPTTSETSKQLKHLSAEEAFDELVGQSSTIQTPVRNVYTRKSTLQKSPFSNTDVISDLPKTDIQEWVDSLENVDIPANAELDAPEEEISMIIDDNEISYDPLSATKVSEANKENKADDTTCQDTTISEGLINISAVSSVVDPLSRSVVLSTEKKNVIVRGLSPVNESLPSEETGIEPEIESEISGIKLLDHSGDSNMLEPLVVSDTDSNLDTTFDNEDPKDVVNVLNDTLAVENQNLDTEFLQEGEMGDVLDSASTSSNINQDLHENVVSQSDEKFRDEKVDKVVNEFNSSNDAMSLNLDLRNSQNSVESKSSSNGIQFDENSESQLDKTLKVENIKEKNVLNDTSEVKELSVEIENSEKCEVDSLHAEAILSPNSSQQFNDGIGIAPDQSFMLKNAEAATDVLKDTTEAKKQNVDTNISEKSIKDALQKDRTQEINENIVNHPDESLVVENLEEVADNDTTETKKLSVDTNMTGKCVEDSILADTTPSLNSTEQFNENVDSQRNKSLIIKNSEEAADVLKNTAEVKKLSVETNISGADKLILESVVSEKCSENELHTETTSSPKNIPQIHEHVLNQSTEGEMNNEEIKRKTQETEHNTESFKPNEVNVSSKTDIPCDDNITASQSCSSLTNNSPVSHENVENQAVIDNTLDKEIKLEINTLSDSMSSKQELSCTFSLSITNTLESSKQEESEVQANHELCEPNQQVPDVVENHDEVLFDCIKENLNHKESELQPLTKQSTYDNIHKCEASEEILEGNHSKLIEKDIGAILSDLKQEDTPLTQIKNLKDGATNSMVLKMKEANSMFSKNLELSTMNVENHISEETAFKDHKSKVCAEMHLNLDTNKTEINYGTEAKTVKNIEINIEKKEHLDNTESEVELSTMNVENHITEETAFKDHKSISTTMLEIREKNNEASETKVCADMHLNLDTNKTEITYGNAAKTAKNIEIDIEKKENLDNTESEVAFAVAVDQYLLPIDVNLESVEKLNDDTSNSNDHNNEDKNVDKTIDTTKEESSENNCKEDIDGVGTNNLIDEKNHGLKISQTINQTIVDEKLTMLGIQGETSTIDDSKDDNLNVLPNVDLCDGPKLNIKDSKNDANAESGAETPIISFVEKMLDGTDIPKEPHTEENDIDNCNEVTEVSSNQTQFQILGNSTTDSVIGKTCENRDINQKPENQTQTINAPETKEDLGTDNGKGVKNKKTLRSRTTRRCGGEMIKDHNIVLANDECPKSTSVENVSVQEVMLNIDKHKSDDNEAEQKSENSKDEEKGRLTRRRKVVVEKSQEDADSEMAEEDVIITKRTRRKITARGPKNDNVDELKHLEKDAPTRRGGRNKGLVETHTDNNAIEEESATRNDEITEEHSNKSRQKTKKHKESCTESTEAEAPTCIENEPVKKRVTRKANIVVKQDETPEGIPAPRRTRKASTIDVTEHSEGLAVTPKRPRRRAGLRTATVYHREESDQQTNSEAEHQNENDDDSQKHTSDECETLTMSRGRTRKPTARAQQFLEEEKSKTGTPKIKVLAGEIDSTPQKLPAKRGRKVSTIDSESTLNSPQLPIKRGRGRTNVVENTYDPSHSEMENHSEEPKVPIKVDEITVVQTSTRRVRGRVCATEHNSEESHLESEPITEVLDIKKEKAKSSKARTRARKEVKSVDVFEEADEHAKKKILNVLPTEEVAVETAATKKRTTGRRRPVNTKVEDNQMELKDEHSSEIEEEKPKKTRSRARVAQKAVAEDPLKREHRVVSASTVDGHSDIDDNNDGNLEANSEENNSAHVAEVSSKRTVASRKVHIETVTESPATKRSRRNPIQEIVNEVLTPTKTRGGGRARKVVTFDTPTAETTDEQIDEAPKRVTRATRKK